jgi:glycosyltransferase involved in cell wall biosynthesis
MRVLVVANLYPTSSHPAFGSFVAERVAALRDAGVEVTVVAIHSPWAHHRLIRKYASLTLRAAVAAAHLLITGRRPDVVEAHIAFPTGLIAWPVARLLGARLALFAHGADVRDVPARWRGGKRVAAWLFRRADLVIANSDFLAALIRERFAAESKALHVVSPGVVVARFRDAASQDRAGLLFVGRLIPEKGVRELLEAVASLERELPSTWMPVLRVAGDGPERLRLEELARAMGIAVDFLGPMNRDAVAAEIGRSAIVVVPSVYDEPLGLVAIEAMASGAIVVASLAGGLRETVHDGVNGFGAEPGDVPSLAQAIGRAVAAFHDPDRAGEIRERAFEVASTHDIGCSVAKTLALFSGERR